MSKPCGHPAHPEDGNLGRIPVGGKVRVEHGEAVADHRNDPQWFVNRHCKLAFPVPGTDHKEYMWVQVLSLEGSELVGRLANTPIQIKDMAHGDLFAFKTHEIIDVDNAL
jgi:uncharacterized protein YegJ (DUF2314 family)